MFGMSIKRAGEAVGYAVTNHEGQFRKDGITPYVTHVLGVAESVYNHGGDEEQIIAALFHDLIEDTDVTYDVLTSRWGSNIANLVDELTNTSKQLFPKANRAERKRIDAERLATVSMKAQLIKLCDILYNINDLEALEGGFARKFLKEKKQCVEIMCDTWTHGEETTAGHWQLRKAIFDTIERRLKEFA